MKNDLNPARLLEAFEIVMAKGEKTELGKIYEGIEAMTDYDGYNVYLRGSGVELHIGFHNTYDLKYDQAHQRDSFLKKIDALLSA
ncbi:DUF3081 domain-containing protein [Enterovibrio norvegicus]|nr:DUF3081 domain-containing protein [Enterovibrio norvegicus]MCC4799808.1 DUF3081 domain-containing protein [Enterovibrio norvegicus]OEE64543.1 hypothetical protein A1OS_15945 [Enterovibrio norvegicus]OEF50747.1 hypothetical protein A1OW_24180 [Enterovibrio norvegicus]OEF56165.1 hypothetical protein A1OU_15440 [Enterovibrio norvegicus]PMH62065.1 hypothetical protein BCU62_19820 [Enterovibrio norvegicus]